MGLESFHRVETGEEMDGWMVGMTCSLGSIEYLTTSVVYLTRLIEAREVVIIGTASARLLSYVGAADYQDDDYILI